MLDVGWTELVVIAIVLIIVVGPKDLPPMLRTFGKMMTKMRGMANDFRHQFDEALKEADLDDVRKTLSDAQKLNPAHSIREAMNPLRQMGNDIKADLQKATAVDTKPREPVMPAPAEMAAEAVIPQEQPKTDPVAAAAIASAAKQMERAAEAETPKARRVSKPKTAVADAAVSQPVKMPAKKARAVAPDGEKPKVSKVAAKTTRKKGDA
ncbi:Sec-independent protein translocase protein TatB [Pararhizobium sp. YC-54]|uniref:Sec-independent protein translocase protein TatB n=1 Tax=Pararhizobium sp. YC-54 TaxID=2986920 RepID=UPI0021F7EE2A|nr:Sec-independent protein translocase protein TatB [Pararhizobium sp. YC-54]MCV9997141.1 Sec-independent protein translocase protein TatB [Pararhizobium sp. YC-54]